jgi:hypothetical protein
MRDPRPRRDPRGAAPAPDQKFTAIEKDTSDEDLWRHACEAKPAPKKP